MIEIFRKQGAGQGKNASSEWQNRTKSHQHDARDENQTTHLSKLSFSLLLIGYV
jgi:hypothetical protein